MGQGIVSVFRVFSCNFEQCFAFVRHDLRIEGGN